MLRFVLAAAVIAPFVCAQNLPEFQWVKQVDTSGLDTFAGLGVDAAGNTYIAGSTSSANFPVQSAAQKTIASTGLYLITGGRSGSTYAPLPLSSASFVAIDPQNPSTVYAVSNGTLLRSTNSGSAFTALSLPSSQISTLAINPSNDQVLYAGTYDQGLFKSTDGGATWNTSNGSLQALQPGETDFEYAFEYVWIDPTDPNVLLANAVGDFVQSSDGGATWQLVFSDTDVTSVSFDTAVPGLVYAVTNGGIAFVSTDHGQGFADLTPTYPANLGAILPDPAQPGRLIGAARGAVYLSTDNGATWASALNLNSLVNVALFAVDWQYGFLYFATSSTVIRVTTDLNTVTPVGPPATGFVSSIAAANGIAYAANTGSSDVYVTKLDPSGNIVYSTYFGGSDADVATAIAVDSSGRCVRYRDHQFARLPGHQGCLREQRSQLPVQVKSGWIRRLFDLWSGRHDHSRSAVDRPDRSGVYRRHHERAVTTTPGAYQTTCQYCGIASNGFFGVITNSGYACKFDPTGSTLLYSTYIGGEIQLQGNIITNIAAASDGSLYLGGFSGLFHLNAAGSALLGSAAPPSFTAQAFIPQAMAIAPDGSVYVGGTATTFATTPGAFQTSYASNLRGAVIARWDSQLANVLDATFFGPEKSINAVAFDSDGNVYLGGGTSQQGLPTRTPIQLGFASGTGFLSEFSGDLSTLIFSSYFGDTTDFSVGGIGVAKNGAVLLGGLAGTPGIPGSPFNPWVNSLSLAPPPALRVDSVVNAASLFDGPISPGETVIVQGAGFGSAPELTINGIDIPVLSKTLTTVTATVPQSLPVGAAEVQVSAGAGSSNKVLVPVNPTSPAIFSQNGSGAGQGYI